MGGEREVHVTGAEGGREGTGRQLVVAQGPAVLRMLPSPPAPDAVFVEVEVVPDSG